MRRAAILRYLNLTPKSWDTGQVQRRLRHRHLNLRSGYARAILWVVHHLCAIHYDMIQSEPMGPVLVP
jgi:hypothetical protein